MFADYRLLLTYETVSYVSILLLVGPSTYALETREARGHVGKRQPSRVTNVISTVKSTNFCLVRTFPKTAFKPAKTDRTVMLFLIVVVLAIAGHGASAATTTPNPAIQKFQAVVDSEVAQLWAGLHHNGSDTLQESDLTQIFTLYDDNQDNLISQSEFFAHFTAHRPNLDTIAEGLFFELDMDNDNYITGSDMKRYYDKIDKDGSGVIDKTEFVVYFKNVLTLLFVLQYESQLSSTMSSVHS